MKIVLVASTFPASDADATPAFVRDLVVALRRRFDDLHIDVLAPQHGDRTPPVRAHELFVERRFAYFFPRAAQRLAGRGIMPTVEHRPVLALLIPFLFAGEAAALWSYVRRERPDVIYAHWFTPQGVVAAMISSLTGVPWVLTSHANDVRVWRKLPGIGRRVVRALLPTATRITAVSRITLDKMRSFFSDEEWASLSERTAIIPMGVDVADLSSPTAVPEALKQKHGYVGRRVVYFIGRLAEKKGVSFLLEAFSRLRAEGGFDDVRLVVAGSGPLLNELEEKTRRSGLSEVVRFVGYVHGQEKKEWLELADVVAVPSIETDTGDSEGFPVVVMEALAAGKIIVASDATGTEDVLVDGRNAFTVPSKDSSALAAGIAGALSLDEASARAMSEQARRAAEQLDWSAIAARHYEFLFAPFAR